MITREMPTLEDFREDIHNHLIQYGREYLILRLAGFGEDGTIIHDQVMNIKIHPKVLHEIENEYTIDFISTFTGFEVIEYTFLNAAELPEYFKSNKPERKKSDFNLGVDSL
jgi:hypothetical protein